MRFASEAKKNALLHSYIHRPHGVLGRGLEMSDLNFDRVAFSGYYFLANMTTLNLLSLLLTI